MCAEFVHCFVCSIAYEYAVSVSALLDGAAAKSTRTRSRASSLLLGRSGSVCRRVGFVFTRPSGSGPSLHASSHGEGCHPLSTFEILAVVQGFGVPFTCVLVCHSLGG